MKAIWLLPLSFSMVVSGCGEAPEDVSAATLTGAEFRHWAHSAYEALLMESCEGDPRLRRETVLAAEREAMRAFEDRLGGKPAADHLAVARSDIDRRHRSHTLGCWSDDDPVFAKMHIRPEPLACLGLRGPVAWRPISRSWTAIKILKSSSRLAMVA
jgi:hypothetical protein